MNKLECLIKGWIATIRGGWPFNFPVSGHEWVDTEEHHNVTVTVSECELCGKVDLTWKKDGKNNIK